MTMKKLLEVNADYVPCCRFLVAQRTLLDRSHSGVDAVLAEDVATRGRARVTCAHILQTNGALVHRIRRLV